MYSPKSCCLIQPLLICSATALCVCVRERESERECVREMCISLLLALLRTDEAHPAASSKQAEHEQIIKNLQRENAMIATAWYDLTSRLQSNHVVLQRKDQPKSWLNKQRQMVNGESCC